MPIKILITGDFCPINRIQDFIVKKSYERIYNDFLPFVMDSDLAITNLECPLTEVNTPIEKSGPALKCSKSSIDALTFAGFHLVTLANNHILDYGAEGVKDTLDACSAAGIQAVGAGMNAEEAREVFYTEIEGKKIGIYNVAENEYGNTYGKEAGANALDPISNYYDITQARKNCDFLFVIAHGGREHYPLPSPRVQGLYRYFIDLGADGIIAHHTHCYSGYEHYKGKPIFYSLGNFVFDYKKKYQKGLWVEGYAIQLIIEDDKLDFKLIPYHQGREIDPSIRLFNEKDSQLFEKRIGELNKIIGDTELIEKEWKQYLDTQRIGYKGLLYIQNKYIREAVRRKLMPPIYFNTKEHSLVLLNLLRCETHREIMIETLRDEINN